MSGTTTARSGRRRSARASRALALLFVAACAGPPADAETGSEPDAAPRAAVDAAAGGAVDAGAADAGERVSCGPPAGERCGACGTVWCDGDAPACEPGPGACDAFVEVLRVDVGVDTGWTEHGGGLAFGDVNGDGNADVALAGPDRLRVYTGDGAGGFAELATPALAGPRQISSVTLADYDGDADLDLLATANGPEAGIHLYANDGAGGFADVTATAGFPVISMPRGAAWGDYDGDGDLDLFVAGYYGSASALLRNRDGVDFEDVAPALGLDHPLYASFQGVWLDYDRDGDLDLFVTTDRGELFGVPSKLYRNDGAAGFADVGAAAGIDHLIDGMGVAVGDVDGDEDLDLYVTNIGSLGPGQVLYLNQGDGTFALGSDAWRAAVPDRVGWGAALFDYDDDGDLDLAFAAHPSPRPWIGESWGAGFLDVTDAIGALPPEPQHGLATADFDGDGRLDLGWLTQDATVGARLYRNAVPTTGHWVRIRLVGPSPNHYAIGALVTVQAGGRRHLRPILAGDSYLSSSEPIAHIGLGAATTIDRIEIQWPDGATTITEGPLPTNQLLTLPR